MQDIATPKIILNEEYIDLRKYPENSLSSKRSTGTHTTHQKDGNSGRITNLRSEGLRFEKELINCGLKKLVTSYNATANANTPPRQQINKKKMRIKEKSMFDPRFHRIVAPDQKPGLKSQSEVSVGSKKVNMDQTCTSTPLFQSKKTSNIDIESIDRNEPHKNKCTMTKLENHEGQVKVLKPTKKSQFTHRRSKSKDYQQKESHRSTTQEEFNIINQYVDPRLCEKYSILKMPWKGTWTIPVCSRKSSNVDNENGCDNFDRQTYLYDDGTEIDSVCIEDQKMSLQTQCMTILCLGGGACGILLVSLLIWYIFGNDFFHIFLRPAPDPSGFGRGPRDLTYFIKLMGGGLMHIITSFIAAIGNILTTPTQRVYHSQPEQYRWTPSQP